MEITADIFGIEKTRAYTPEQLITKILIAYRSVQSEKKELEKSRKIFSNLFGEKYGIKVKLELIKKQYRNFSWAGINRSG